MRSQLPVPGRLVWKILDRADRVKGVLRSNPATMRVSRPAPARIVPALVALFQDPGLLDHKAPVPPTWQIT